MMLKALICDDEAPARGELRYLLDEAGGVEVVGEAGSAIEALQLIKGFSFDVVFLDIDMPGLSGMQLAEVLASLDRQPAIVFVTAYSEHAVKAFEVAATDYLVKPVELPRLKQALERLQPAEAGATRIERVPVEKAGKKLLLSVEDIFYVMAKDDYSYLYTDARAVSLDDLARAARVQARVARVLPGAPAVPREPLAGQGGRADVRRHAAADAEGQGRDAGARSRDAACRP